MNRLDAQKNIDRNAQFHLMELTAPITETLLELMFDDSVQNKNKESECSFLYLVDYIVSYSYCKLTIIFSIPNSTCQSSILFLVSIYILHSSS